MAQLDQSVLDEIRARADIVDIVGQYVVLKRAGHHYKGLCPFHSEKTPSFTVNPERQIFKCFGCGAGGDVFRFLMDSQQMGFMDVVHELARQYGVVIKVQEADSQQEQKRVQLRRLNHEASVFFQQQLQQPVGQIARDYLQQRGISTEIQQRFQVGYAPESWDQLLLHLQKQGFDDGLLAESGLFKPSEKSGRLYDFFRHRIMFPIVGVNGDTLAFGGRTLNPDLGAKYINSPETAIYQKGQHVYGLNLAKKAIRSKDRAILVEGYLDVISAHQAGFEETVAALGTALTPDQARQLLRFSESKRIYMAYDADSAGQKAADRGADILEQVAQGALLRVQVIQIPDKEDPDTFLQKFGPEAFEQLLASAPDFAVHYLDKQLSAHDLSNPVDKALAAKACLQTLQRFKDPVLRDEYLRYVAQRLEITEQALRDQAQQARRRPAKKGFQKAEVPAEAPRIQPLPLQDRDFMSELGLLHLVLSAPSKAAVLSELSEMRFADSHNEALRQYLVTMAEAGLELGWQELLSVFPGAEVQQRLSEISENPAFQHLDFEKSLADFSRNVKLKCLGTQMQQLSQEIQQMGSHSGEAPADADASHDTALQAQGAETDRQATYQAKMMQYMELTQAYQRLKQMSL